MSCCNCTFTYDLGCFDTCSEIEFGDADATGDFTLQFSPYPGRTIKMVLAFTAGDPIIYTDDGLVLQPGYGYVMQIKNPDGTTFTRTIDDVIYDCFTFTMNRTTTVLT